MVTMLFAKFPNINTKLRPSNKDHKVYSYAFKEVKKVCKMLGRPDAFHCQNNTRELFRLNHHMRRIAQFLIYNKNTKS